MNAPPYGETIVRYICPDAPAQVTAEWYGERTECPWCHRLLSDHDHHLWSIQTGTTNPRPRSEAE